MSIYREQPAGERFNRWVECCWILQTDEPLHAYPVRPDGCLDLIYSPGDGVQVVGAMTTERRFDVPAGAHTFGMRFRPGMAAPLLGVAADELTDRTLAWKDLRGSASRSLESALADACSPDALLAAIGTPPATPDAVQRAIEAITAAHGEIDLDWVARHAGLSARQFRRRCLETSGLTPKHLCRILRFRRACALAGRRAEWSAVAADAGYYDQSHLIRDFHEFTGRTPMSVFSNTHLLPLR